MAGPCRSAETEIQPLDADFLEYLANLEGDDDDWTLLAEISQEAHSPSERKPAPASTPRKPNKEAAMPAAEER